MGAESPTPGNPAIKEYQSYDGRPDTYNRWVPNSLEMRGTAYKKNDRSL